MHEVEVIAKSVGKGPTITTVRLRYWRAIHSEFMTHRAFSRNASSSRAVPTAKLAAVTTDDMFVPKFRKNKPGMQPGEFLGEYEQESAEIIWQDAAKYCLEAAKTLANPDGLNIHKQWSNRMLEWFGYINVLVTSTEWDNFFKLRLETNPDGSPVPQDEMYHLAVTMKEKIDAFEPKILKPFEWHLPYVTEEEMYEYGEPDRKRISAARCASISYQTVDGKQMTPQKAIDLCNKLLERQHYSPFEHQAMADDREWGWWCHQNLHANYVGWAQWRHFIMEKFNESKNAHS